MSFFVAPDRRNYATYQHYAMAALGYACLDSRVVEGCVDKDSIFINPFTNVSGVWSDFRVVEGPVGTRNCDAECCKRKQGHSVEVVDDISGHVVDASRSADSFGGRVVEAKEAIVESVGLPGDSLGPKVNNKKGFKPGVVGPNYERNRKNRQEQKARKAARRAMGISARDWRDSRIGNSGAGVPATDGGLKGPAVDSGNGFWNSCSADVRQELIDSKARMHIADNNKKTQESERRLKQLQSPEQLLKDAMRMVDFASDQAKKQNDSKVCGWAMTVAESYAQTIARSAPTSVESFDEFVKSNSSVTSVSLEVFEELKTECEQLKSTCSRLESQLKELLSEKKKVDEKNTSLEKKQDSITKRLGNSIMQDICAKVPSGVSGSSGRPVLNQEFFLRVQAEKRRREANGFYEMK